MKVHSLSLTGEMADLYWGHLSFCLTYVHTCICPDTKSSPFRVLGGVVFTAYLDGPLLL